MSCLCWSWPSWHFVKGGDVVVVIVVVIVVMVIVVIIVVVVVIIVFLSCLSKVMAWENGVGLFLSAVCGSVALVLRSAITMNSNNKNDIEQ